MGLLQTQAAFAASACSLIPLCRGDFPRGRTNFPMPFASAMFVGPALPSQTHRNP